MAGVSMVQRVASQRLHKLCGSVHTPCIPVKLKLCSRRPLEHVQLKSHAPLAATHQQLRTNIRTNVFPFDQAWAPSVDAASLAPQLFATSLFPYLCFLFFLTKSGKTPPLTLFGFYFLLVFVGATIPAGIYAKTHYGTSLANVDWLHGVAESLLTVTNLFIVLGLRQGIRDAEAARKVASTVAEGTPGQPESSPSAATSSSSPSAGGTA